METEHTETVIDKAVTFVKDMFGMHPETEPEAPANPEYSESPAETAAEDAMRLDPNTYEGLVSPAGEKFFVRENEIDEETGMPRKDIRD